MLNSVKWEEFELEKLFIIENTLSFNKDKLTTGDEYDYVTRTSQNQGILQTTGFVNTENINPAGNWSLGLLQMDFFYRNKPWYAGQFVRKITPKIVLPPKTINFFSSILNKQKPILLSVLVRDVDDVFRNIKIKLPVKKSNNNMEGNIGEIIDFDFMQSFVAELEAQRVAELEAQRVAELEAYLLKTGLSNYTLTEKEMQVIDNINNSTLGGGKWQSFNLKQLFGSATRGKRLKSDDRIVGNLPFVTAGEANTGISAFIGNPVHIFNANTVTIDMFGSAKYRNYDYGADDHIAVVHTESLPPLATMFIASAIHKASYFSGKFSYSRNFYAKDADELTISLPCKSGKPDYDYMAAVMSAVQKLVIKEVVDYSDKKMKAYCSCVD
ncbi:type I restriction modification DNA specificity protein [Volucribacter psittacicida]|uniref:Type I restriction modification DNA specificity protein n=1 Tax=Volucribacter psittacicida TaxID=203482 RepID=A0A4R1FRL4_9PAST|nr:restriction endonuclease subunit S [Volucribacter psittacicida]TCJ96212.1 type I restriction modification DNA specificity protein [Volucribacter psittacicida]